MSSAADAKNARGDGDRHHDDDDDDQRIMAMGEDEGDELAADSKNAGGGRRGSAHRAIGLNLDSCDAPHAGDEQKKGNVSENSLLVIFELPDGSQGESHFKLGQTVELMKSFVESEYRIPMAQQTLLYEDKPMMNPMSLLDYLREAKGAGCWWGVGGVCREGGSLRWWRRVARASLDWSHLTPRCATFPVLCPSRSCFFHNRR